MKLNAPQKKALKDFHKYGYVVIEAPRRSGKTTLLRYLASQYDEVYIQTLNYQMFKYLYGDIVHVKYLAPDAANPKSGIIIGDEVFITPIRGIKTACAITPPHIIQRWSTDIDKKVLKNMKVQMADERFRSEFML